MKIRPDQVAKLLLAVLFVLLLPTPSAPLSPPDPGPDGPIPIEASVPAIALRAASGATIAFVTQNGRTIQDVPPQTLELPHLVLARNGVLNDAVARTVILEVTGIDVPPAGVTVTLELETQHRDPDLGELSGQRIPVWQESRWIANTAGVTQTNLTATFVHEFGAVTFGPGRRATPTDYFRYDVTVTDANHPLTEPTYGFSQDYAFLMENQWVARLPEVSEATTGAAPDELVVYYCDMFPFQRDAHDPATRLPREAVTDYVGAELVSQMVEAFRVQTDEWGFSWHDAWSSYRPEDEERLSVALVDGRTWFHGKAPDGGHAGISLRVSGGNSAGYSTLADGLLSSFHHELFHNLQENLSLHSGGNGRLDSAQEVWKFFSEGTAVLAATVGRPGAHFAETVPTSIYMSHANLFVQYGGGAVQDLNTSYAEMDPYRAAIYWRYLYEQCGGMKDGVEDPAAGMQVARRALAALYSGEIVDIRSSTDLVGALPAIMDRALASSSCPFRTYEESLSAFARAIYALRLDRGDCVAPGSPNGCGLYDPYEQYQEPPFSTIAYVGVDHEYRDGITGSFGIDLVEVHLDPAAEGQLLVLEFQGDRTSEAAFHVQLVRLVDSVDGTRPRHVSAETRAVEILARVTSDGHRRYVIPVIDTAVYNRLGLIITRLDTQEASDPTGAYTLVLRPGIERDGEGISTLSN